MSGIKSLFNVYEQRGEEFLKRLLDNYIIINEQATGSIFGVKIESDRTFTYFKKNAQISFIDRILMRYYERAISHFEGLNDEAKMSIPAGYVFYFEYNNETTDDDSNPATILILTHIYIEHDAVYINDKKTLDRWAEILNVGKPRIVFEGHLDDEQKTKILDFVYTPYDKLVKKFKVTSFTKYILGILNPGYNTTGEIDGIVFRFYETDPQTDKQVIALSKIVDPTFEEVTRQIQEEPKKANDYVYIIIIELMNFIETYSLRDLNAVVNKSLNFEQNYIKLMHKIYVDFINQYQNKYIDIKIDLPKFMQRPDFDVNVDLIHDEEVLKIIKLSDTFKEIYKILLNFFRKKKKNAQGIFNTNMLLQFNSLVDKLRKVVIGDNVYESYVPNFYEFTNNISEEFNFFEKVNIKDGFKKYKTRRKVNIIVDQFQPFTNEHLIAAQAMNKKNGLKTVLVYISNKYPTKARPFCDATVIKLLNMVRSKNTNFIQDIVTVHLNNIESILDTLHPMYQPILWAASKQKLDDYILQLDYAKKKDLSYNISNKFKLIELPISNNATRILDYITVENYKLFKDLAPESIHSEFFNLKQELKNR